MGERVDPKQLVTFEELLRAMMIEQETKSVNNRFLIYNRRVVYGRKEGSRPY